MPTVTQRRDHRLLCVRNRHKFSPVHVFVPTRMLELSAETPPNPPVYEAALSPRGGSGLSLGWELRSSSLRCFFSSCFFFRANSF